MRAAVVGLYLAVSMLVLYVSEERYVDFQVKVDDEVLLRGTWNQYGTQLLTEQGYWAEAAAYATNNTEPTIGAMRALLED